MSCGSKGVLLKCQASLGPFTLTSLSWNLLPFTLHLVALFLRTTLLLNDIPFFTTEPNNLGLQTPSSLPSLPCLDLSLALNTSSRRTDALAIHPNPNCTNVVIPVSITAKIRYAVSTYVISLLFAPCGMRIVAALEPPGPPCR
jgi:hypothetical protein